jgi:ribosomal protein S1
MVVAGVQSTRNNSCMDSTGFMCAPAPASALRGAGAPSAAKSQAPSAGSAGNGAVLAAAAAAAAGLVARAGTVSSRTTRGSRTVVFAKSVEVGGIYDGTVLRGAKFGVFFDIGAENDVLGPTQFLDKAPEEYKAGDKLKLKVVKMEGDRITVSTDLEGKAPSMDGIKVGAQVTGTVATINPAFGIFFNIGAPRDALCRTNQLAKPLSEYKVGDEVPGLVISGVNKQKEQIEVTTRRMASSVKSGEKFEGTVASVADFGVFFDVGLSSDVLAPVAYLSKAPGDYAKGEVADLIVFKVDGDKISVTTKADMGTPLGNMVRGSTVTGKVVRVDESFGVFFDVGAVTSALCRPNMLPKDISEYKVGDEQEGLIVTQVNENLGQIEVSSREGLAKASSSGAGGGGPTRLSALKVGQEVTGTVKRSAPFGVFVDIGAERDALWAANQLDKPTSDYSPGEKISGLKITECNPTTQRLAVSTRKSAAEFKVGESVTGTITKIMAFGVFVNIGASTEALAPARLLEKEPNEYQVGEELSGLNIAQLDAENNKISVGQVEGAGGGAAASGMGDLKVGSKVQGIVRKSMDYGCFVDVGLGRTDALLPKALMPEERTPASYKPGDTIDVYIANVDTQKNRVTLSVKEPDATMMGGPKMQQVGKGGLPQDDMFPDAKSWIAKQGGDEAIVDDEGIPWKDWEKKYPGLIKFPKKEVELYMAAQGYGFSGVNEAACAEPAYIPIPVHLRKPDAAQPEIPEFSFDDYELGYEYGIKPEIHTKYRMPPFNDPNWTYRPPQKAMKK